MQIIIGSPILNINVSNKVKPRERRLTGIYQVNIKQVHIQCSIKIFHGNCTVSKNKQHKKLLISNYYVKIITKYKYKQDKTYTNKLMNKNMITYFNYITLRKKF